MTAHALHVPFVDDDSAHSTTMPLKDAVRRGLLAAKAMPDLPTERVVIERACGRILANPLSNHDPLPRYDVAVMDGYAIRRGDLIGPGPWTLPVNGRIEAGTRKNERPECEPGGALEAMTGAQIFGALDAVVPHEHAKRDGEAVTIFRCPSRNSNIRPRGLDAKRGTSLLPAGHILSPRDIALLAGMGRPDIVVRDRLRIACLSIGSELIEVGTKLSRGQMHDCNRPMLAAMLKEDWTTYLDLGVIRDDPQVLATALPLATATADVVVVAGGASGGAETAMGEALKDLGATIVAERIAMKPGKPVMIATLKGALLLCLPGNPVSAAVLMKVLGWDLLHQRVGLPLVSQSTTEAVAGFRMQGKPGRAEFPLVTIKEINSNEVPVLSIVPDAHSGNLRRLSEADGFAHITADHPVIEPGSKLKWTRF